MIRTARLDLVPATEGSLVAALAGADALAAALAADVPEGWPPDLFDDAALQWTRDKLAERPDASAWWLYFVLLRRATDRSVVVGVAGYKGPPDAEGRVEVGYSVVAAFRRRGIATEAVRGLVARAFEDPAVCGVLAETLPDLAASIGVLERCGFALTSGGSEPGVIRFLLPRPVASEGV